MFERDGMENGFSNFYNKGFQYFDHYLQLDLFIVYVFSISIFFIEEFCLGGILKNSCRKDGNSILSIHFHPQLAL